MVRGLRLEGWSARVPCGRIDGRSPVFDGFCGTGGGVGGRGRGRGPRV